MADPTYNLVNVQDFHDKAKQYLPKIVYDYYSSGANDQLTLNENQEAFRKIKLRPRVLIDVSKISTQTTVKAANNQTISLPIITAPTAMNRMAHPEGELASVRAAVKMNTIFTLSTWATSSIEEVGEEAKSVATPENPPKLWFQLYIYRDRSITQTLLKRAENAGFSAVVLTVDTPVLGQRENDLRNSFSLPSHLSLKNFDNLLTENPATITTIKSGDKGSSALARLVKEQQDASLTWADIAWLKSQTSLKIILKGIVRGDDAKLAVRSGVDGIIVSNHGARQVDTVIATIDALEEVVNAVKEEKSNVEVFLDGGIRRGTDVVKAIGLGAKAVLVGRPVLWGLSVAGEVGVNKVYKLLENEVKIALALLGCTTLEEVTRDRILTDPHRNTYEILAKITKANL